MRRFAHAAKRSLRTVPLVWILACAASFTAPVHGQRRDAVTDDQIVQEARLVTSGPRVDLYQHDARAEPALAEAAEKALSHMEALLGRKLDEATLGPRVRIYVSASTAVSHVWRGYAHPRDPKAAVFLNPMAAYGGTRGTNATYAHELAHLLTWRYHSHTLREGLADYLALQLHPGASTGPNTRGYASPPAVPPAIMDYLGTSRPPPDEVTSQPAYRQAYYFASYRFARYLIGRAGLETFMKLYDAPDPEAEAQHLYGTSVKELAEASAREK